MTEKWMQKAFKHSKEGALRQQLGYPAKRTIPRSTLLKIKRTKIGNHVYVNGKSRKVTHLLKNRATLAYTAGKSLHRTHKR